MLWPWICIIRLCCCLTHRSWIGPRPCLFCSLQRSLSRLTCLSKDFSPCFLRFYVLWRAFLSLFSCLLAFWLGFLFGLFFTLRFLILRCRLITLFFGFTFRPSLRVAFRFLFFLFILLIGIVFLIVPRRRFWIPFLPLFLADFLFFLLFLFRSFLAFSSPLPG